MFHVGGTLSFFWRPTYTGTGSQKSICIDVPCSQVGVGAGCTVYITTMVYDRETEECSRSPLNWNSCQLLCFSQSLSHLTTYILAGYNLMNRNVCQEERGEQNSAAIQTSGAVGYCTNFKWFANTTVMLSFFSVKVGEVLRCGFQSP